MGIKIHRSWASDNPSGVVINPGWYALAEAILTKQTTCAVLQKWCGVSESRGWTKKDTSCTGEKMKKIIKIYRRNKGKLPHSVIAELVGCTREYVSIVLKKKLGIGGKGTSPQTHDIQKIKGGHQRMRKLYEIQDDLARIIEIGADRFVDGETGEIISKEDFDNLQMEWSAKVEGVALGYKNEDAEAKAIKEEIDKLTERMNRHKRKAEGYKNFLAMVLEGKKFESAKALVKPTKSKVCEWDGSFEGLEKYAIPQEPKFDKASARKDLLAGVNVPHCTLVEKTSVSIK